MTSSQLEQAMVRERNQIERRDRKKTMLPSQLEEEMAKERSRKKTCWRNNK